jgi:hypothetical protein
MALARSQAVMGARGEAHAALSEWRTMCSGSPFPAGNGNKRYTPVMPSRSVLLSDSNEARAVELLAEHERQDTEDALGGYQETVAGIYAAHDLLTRRARSLRARHSPSYITREAHQSIRVGTYRGMTVKEYRFRDELYTHSHIIARFFETSLAFGWLYPPVWSLPPMSVFLHPDSLIAIIAASFPSLGEAPGGFADGPLGRGQDGFWRDLCPETGGTFSLVIDYFPPMSVNIPSLHDGENAENQGKDQTEMELTHIDIRALERRLGATLRSVFARNHRAAVELFRKERAKVLRGCD